MAERPTELADKIRALSTQAKLRLAADLVDEIKSGGAKDPVGAFGTATAIVRIASDEMEAAHMAQRARR